MNLDATLSNRETEVAEVMAFAKCKHDAADKLCISEGTLSAHSFRIYEKLQINSKSELICVEIGLTKREYFAGLAMQGLISSFTEKASYGGWGTEMKETIKCAIDYADELLKQLEKQ